MYILSLETSTKNFSLAVSKDDQVLRFRNIRTAKILESSIIASIEKLLSSCDLKFDDINALAIGLGPGSFTSLSVGLSTVKAFAMAKGLNVVGVGSLDVIASGVLDETIDEICVIVDARRGKVYAAIYDVGAGSPRPFASMGGETPPLRKTEYLLTTIEDVLTRVKGTTLFVGDGLVLYKKAIEEAYTHLRGSSQGLACKALFAAEKFWYPQSKELAKLAFIELENKQSANPALHQDGTGPATMVPIYLYPEDCQVERK